MRQKNNMGNIFVLLVSILVLAQSAMTANVPGAQNDFELVPAPEPTMPNKPMDPPTKAPVNQKAPANLIPMNQAPANQIPMNQPGQPMQAPMNQPPQMPPAPDAKGFPPPINNQDLHKFDPGLNNNGPGMAPPMPGNEMLDPA